MALTVIGDPHAQKDNLDKIGDLFEIAEELGNDVVILGDMLHSKETIRGKVINFIFTKLKDSKLNWIILTGNHEWFNLQCYDHSLQVFKTLHNVTIVDKPLVKGNIAYLPYMSPENAAKAVKDLPKGVEYLFAHLDVCGYDYGNGRKSEEGLTLKQLKRFKLVISGHYHAYQRENPLVYLGTPFSHSFGETDQDKYIGVFENGDLQLLASPFPRHRTFEVDCTQPEELDYQEGDLVRVFLYGPQDAIAAYPRAEGIKYIERPTTEEEAQERVVDESQSAAIQFENWASKIRGIEDKAIIKAGVELLEEVSSV